MDRSRSRYEDLLSLSTPKPEDSADDFACNLPWILTILDEKEADAPERQLKKSEPKKEYFAEPGNSFSSLFYNNSILDQGPSSPSFGIENEQNQDSSNQQIMSLLEASAEAAKNSFDLERSSYNIFSDDRWYPNTFNSSQVKPSWLVSCYSPLSTQIFGNIFFFIDGGGDSWSPSTTMKTSCVDSNNTPIPVEMTKENLPDSNRYVCTFYAPTPGCYTVTVCDGVLSFHIKGSPLVIPVTRNYKMYSTWKKSRVFYSKAIKPWGIAYCSSTNRVYVTDRDAHQIIIYHEDGLLDKCFGKNGSKPGELYRPTGIAVDNLTQRLIITDKDNHRISIYTLDGQFISCFGKKGYKNGEFTYPWGVAVSPKDSTIAVADSRNHRLQIFDYFGNFLRKYSAFETNPFEFKTVFNYPRGISFDKDGENIYVTDFNIQTIFKFNLDLTEKSIILPTGIHLCRPQGIAIDLVGNFLICDSRNNCIRVISPGGEHISSIVGHSTNSFMYPQDLTITSTGDIIVVDNYSTVHIL